MRTLEKIVIEMMDGQPVVRRLTAKDEDGRPIAIILPLHRGKAPDKLKPCIEALGAFVSAIDDQLRAE